MNIDAYQVRIRQQPRSRKDPKGIVKGQAGVVWFVSVTHPEWINGTDGIGASVLVHPGDSPDWIQSKRTQLVNTLIAQAEANQLPIDGLPEALEPVLAEIRA
jgi:hypothetical protein